MRGLGRTRRCSSRATVVGLRREVRDHSYCASTLKCKTFVICETSLGNPHAACSFVDSSHAFWFSIFTSSWFAHEAFMICGRAPNRHVAAQRMFTCVLLIDFAGMKVSDAFLSGKIKSDLAPDSVFRSVFRIGTPVLPHHAATSLQPFGSVSGIHSLQVLPRLGVAA